MEVETRNRILRALKKESLLAAFILLVVFSTTAAAEQAPTFHGIKLGVSLGSQFQECPRNPPKVANIPDIIVPDKDDKGNAIPCFYDMGLFKPAAYPQVTSAIELIEHFKVLKDAEGKYFLTEPLPGIPIVYIELVVPASALLRDGTIERVIMEYHPLEADRVRDALIKKFGASHPPDNKVDPKVDEYVFGNKVSREVWKTDWGELSLAVTDKFAAVIATTSKLARFEQEKKKDEF